MGAARGERVPADPGFLDKLDADGRKRFMDHPMDGTRYKAVNALKEAGTARGAVRLLRRKAREWTASNTSFGRHWRQSYLDAAKLIEGPGR